MDPRRTTAVALGGILGAASRWAVAEGFGEPGAWPWAVLVANLVGCALLGVIVGRYGALAGTTAFVAATAGFCGALTTFSGFALDVALFLDVADWMLAAGYLSTSVIAGLVAYVWGREAGRLRPSPRRP